MDYALYVLLAVFVVWMFYKQFTPVKGLRNLQLREFKEEYKGNKLIDVRESREYTRGYIPGAVNIPLSQLKQRLGEIPKDKPVYLYCQSGMRSKQAGKILSNNGYGQIAHLTGGIMAWDGPTKK
ncbi:rhodanese-like domain-containing protein [Paenibacillus validus]|uniref:rhodanese-like domain-containing protein n=1 Tax=Paenibacillus TaxID=44249 RepID=UPI000FD90B1F|nr:MULTISPECIES: rhodanese-like domain-containing protein [Paenibacillus]MED4602021.1 rhodanese-like domain-containing protein [Paenibacillus validus]MED4605383.1 rhodanese-like domain-containing protein [Paenibacillus validus]